MHVSHLALVDFRSYAQVEVDIPSGVSAFIGPNGQGKTNLVEAIDYVATQSSHRVASDQPLVRFGADAGDRPDHGLQRDDRQALIELEINPGKANRARLNRGALPRARDALGHPAHACCSRPTTSSWSRATRVPAARFLDDLLVARQPRFAGVRSDYDRVLKQRNTLLKTAGGRGTGRRNEGALSTLDVVGRASGPGRAELLAARLDLVDELRPHVARHYADVAQSVPKAEGGNDAALQLQAVARARARRPDARRARCQRCRRRSVRRRDDELDRGVTLVGPHRDDLTARRSARCRPRATRATVSRGPSRSRSGWRRSSCSVPTATIPC